MPYRNDKYFTTNNKENLLTKIPSLGEYYYQDGKYHLKSQFSKYFKVSIIIGFVLGCLGIPMTTAQSHISEKYTWTYTKSKYSEYIIDTNPSISKKEATDIAVAMIKWADYYKLDHNLLFAVAKIESRFDKYAISGSGAMGVMQVLAKVHLDKIIIAKKELNNPDIFDLNTNLFIGGRILKDCLDRFKFDKAMNACYNGGDGSNKYADKVLSEYNKLKG